MPRRTVPVLVIAAWLVFGCVAQGSSLDDKQAPTALPRDTTTETHTDGAALDGTTDTGATSRALQCPSSSSGRCTYGTGYRLIETLVVDRNLAALGPTAAHGSGASFPYPPGVPPATFVGMWDADPSEPEESGFFTGLCGYLIIEEPYVRVQKTTHACVYRTDPELGPDNAPNLGFWIVQLPRPVTGYDPDTRSLWVYGKGPMTDGDYVQVYGEEGHRPTDWPGPNEDQLLFWLAYDMAPDE